jgi:trimeric autotransporter adhesin
MKTRLILTALLNFVFLMVIAQVPQGFNYQAIARDSKGNPITNSTIKVKLSILTDTTAFYASGSGTYIWEEEQTNIKTNALGMFTVVFGDPASTKIQGSVASFGAIDWTTTTLFIGVKVANPTDYKNMGSAKLWSVPYGMFSAKVSNGVYTNGSYPNPGWITSMSGSKITGNVPHATLADSANAVTNGSKLSVVGNNDAANDALFEVKRKDGQTVFAVYPNSVNVYVPRTTPKGVKGGFAIGGFDGSKITPQDYFSVTPDSVRIYIDKTPNITKGITKGGFAIGGFDQTKNTYPQDLFTVSNDSIRIYLDANSAPGKGATKGGFAIGGFGQSKQSNEEYFRVTRDSARVNLHEPAKGLKGGFAIGGFGTAKSLVNNYLSLDPNNYFIGHSSGLNNTIGMYNSFIGYESGMANTEGSSNVFMGYQSGSNNTIGSQNLFLGLHSGFNNAGGENNIMLGTSSGYSNAGGSDNIFIGTNSGYSNSGGGENVFIGNSAGFSNSTGNLNIFIGHRAGIYSSSYRNVFIGPLAGEQNTSGLDNVFIGDQTGQYSTTGNGNTFVGSVAGWQNYTGMENTFIGQGSGANMHSGNNNVFIGNQTGLGTAGNRNVYLGYRAGSSNTKDGSVMIGFQAGANEEGSGKLFIENSDANMDNALIYGEFDNDVLNFNATVTVRDLLRLKPRADAPLNPSEGTIYYDSVTHKLKVWNGSEWIACW